VQNQGLGVVSIVIIVVLLALVWWAISRSKREATLTLA